MADHFPEEKISEIRQAADIVDVVSESVLLKKSGRNFLGLCPFHSEKTPSFSVSREKQIFYCFGCGAGGNAISFLMRHDGLSFPEAVRRLAGRYGIELPPQGRSPEERRRYSEKEKLLAINKEAAEFFRSVLSRGGAEGKAALYLKKRSMSEGMMERFQIGYAPSGWDHLTHFFEKKRVPLDLVEKAGLIVTRKSGGGFYDRFRDRIMFPIHDLSGRVLGFGGRVLDDSLPKYLNSPESPVYSKSRSLYGILQARSRCRETRTVFVCEGYFDALSLHQAGVENAVATLGTALTAEHVRMLRGFVGEGGQVVLVYDSDQAGILAAERSVSVFDREYVDAKIIVLPSGHDPDTFIRQHGVEPFEKLAETAREIIPFLIDSAKARHGLTVEGKVRIVADVAGSLSAVFDPVKRSLYVQSLSEDLGIQEAAILEKMRESGPKRGRPEEAPDKRDPDGGRLERKMVAMMLQFPEILDDIADKNVVDLIQDPVLNRVGRYVLENRGRNPVDPSRIISAIDGSEAAVAGLALEEEPWNRAGGLKLISQFLAARLGKQADPIDRKIQAAERGKKEESIEKLLAEKHKKAVLKEKEKMALLRDG